MCAFETNDKKNPSLFLVALCAVLMAFFGALCGFILMTSIAPEPFRSVADYESDLAENQKPKLLHAHYFRGSGSASGDWTEKRKILLEGNDTTVEFTDSEINAWIAGKFEKSRQLPLEKMSEIYAVTGLPNVFIDADEGIHFSIPLEIFWFGKKVDRLLIGQGGFLGDDSNQFSLSKLRLNEAVIPLPENLLKEYILGAVLKSFYQSVEFTELKDAWEKVHTVELTETGIRLNLN